MKVRELLQIELGQCSVKGSAHDVQLTKFGIEKAKRMAENIGKVIQISGPAVDVQFEEATMPPIYQALRVTSEGFDVPSPISVILEVQQHLGKDACGRWRWKAPRAWSAA